MRLGKLMIHFEETGRSRMPVYCDTRDDPRGFVHIRDLLSYMAKQARNKRRSRTNAAAPASIHKPEIAEKQSRPVKAAAFYLARVDLAQNVVDARCARQTSLVPTSML